MKGVNENKIAGLIVRISKDSDQIAFRSFYDIYYHRLLNFAYYFLESTTAAEEVVSSVFINLWKIRAKLLDVKNVESYIFSSTKNKSFDYLRDNKRFIISTDIDHEDDFLIPELDNPETHVLNQELKDKIIESVDNLPPRCKIIFTLVREDGLKYKQVAELLDISVKTVEVQMGKALAKLRFALKSYFHEVDLYKFLEKKNIKTGPKENKS
ncbi:MAG: RNA polymerase sigma-70 factor [Cytophagales bacterium]|nr:RNA polymerase sigma-70 factor [Cytophagales bacterium]